MYLTGRWIQGRIQFTVLVAGILLGFNLGCTKSKTLRLSEVSDHRAPRGVLVMAHGGSEEWNNSVTEAVNSLEVDIPVEIAFGMSDPRTLQTAVANLESKGVREVIVVRLFVSKDSFLDRTKQILGISPGAPEAPSHDHVSEQSSDMSSSHRNMEFWRISTNSRFWLSDSGLLDDTEIVGTILKERVLDLSRDPGNESVLILAHGPGDDTENELWLERMNSQADEIRKVAPFRIVRVMTLREDWPEVREASEASIKRFIAETEGAVIVVPYRVYGFGPYADVLDGLDYMADKMGFLPHPGIGEWLQKQIHRGLTAFEEQSSTVSEFIN